MVIPSGFRTGRVFVRLRRDNDNGVSLVPAAGPAEATHQVVNAWGRPLLTHLAEDDLISRALLRTGYWELAQSLALLGQCRPGMTVVDAGANVGYYAALLAPALGAAGRVLAFEPEPGNHLVLTANALLLEQLFPEAAAVEALPWALADRAGDARLNVFDKNLGLHSLVFGGGPATSSVVVETTTLDALREREEGRRIDLLKADVQGSEMALLRGAERTLERDRPVLCLEFEPPPTGPDGRQEMVEWLAGRGYGAFRLFHAHETDPCRMLTEAVPLLTAGQVAEQVRRQLVGPYGSLLAFPGNPGEGAGRPGG